MSAVYLSLTVLGAAALATLIAVLQVIAEMRPRLARIAETRTPARTPEPKLVRQPFERDEIAARRQAREPSRRAESRASAPTAASQRSTASRW